MPKYFTIDGCALMHDGKVIVGGIPIQFVCQPARRRFLDYDPIKVRMHIKRRLLPAIHELMTSKSLPVLVFPDGKRYRAVPCSYENKGRGIGEVLFAITGPPA